MNNELIEMIVDYIKNMKLGESNSISSIIKTILKQELSTDELFDIQEIVIKKCEEQGILCDYSKYKGSVVGLPFNLDFVKRDLYLDKIRGMFFKNNEDYFDSISSYLIETFDYNILSNPVDNCVRFELYDKVNNKKIFFAVNKNMFLLNDRFKHKLNLRGNSSEERLLSLINDLKSITCSWNLDYKDDGEYYWGLTICNDNKCSLYVGKSVSVENWNKFRTIINKFIEDLLNITIKEIMI